MTAARKLATAFALGGALTAAVVLALGPSAALAEEAPCPNEQLRAESNVNPATVQPYSTQLPDCRAYELVSPPNTGSVPVASQDQGLETLHSYERLTQVTAGGDVFYVSKAVPAGTGAVDNGFSLGVFVSKRTNAGWTTADLTPFGALSGSTQMVAGSADGSAALIDTIATLVPEDQDNPTNNQEAGLTMEAPADDLYRVSESEGAQLVSHGFLLRTYAERSEAIHVPFEFNPELTAVAFQSSARLSPEAAAGATDCYQWSDVGQRQASLTNPDRGTTKNCELLGMTQEGYPVFKDKSGDAYNGLIFVGGATSTSWPIGTNFAYQLSGPASSPATFDGLSPSGEIAYVTTTFHLKANGDTGNDLYAVKIPRFRPTTVGPPQESGVTCISCGHNGAGGATWLGQSADGSHVFFSSSEGLWSWSWQTDTASRLTTATSVSQLVFSANGEYVAGVTSQALAGGDTNGRPDIYEFGTGLASPRLITSGTASSDVYTLVGAEPHGESSVGEGLTTEGGVSDTGGRIVYDDKPTSVDPAVVVEWSEGATSRLSPVGSSHGYYALATAGEELEDVFFIAHEPLVAQDANAGTADIYDARIDGGFSAPPVPASCSGDACQGTPSGPPAGGPAPSSQSFSGAGNHPTPPPAKQKRAHHKKKQQRKKASHMRRRIAKRAANSHRGGVK